MQLYNYKQYFHISLQGKADENYTLICINVGACSTQNDTEVLSAFHLYQHLETKPSMCYLGSTSYSFSRLSTHIIFIKTGLLGCDGVYFGTGVPMFQRNLTPPSKTLVPIHQTVWHHVPK
jgi:hypothetical protein